MQSLTKTLAPESADHGDACHASLQQSVGNKIDRTLVSKKNAEFGQARMTLVHFVVNYPRWSFTLFFILAAWMLPPLPTVHDGVRKPMDDLHTVLETEALNYYQAAVDSFGHVHANLNATAQVESDRVLTSRASNKLLLQKITNQVDKCSMAGNKARELFNEWIDQGMTLPFNENETHCSDSDREEVLNSVGEDIQSVENKVSIILDDYIQAAQESLLRINAYADDRSSYDYRYFVGDRILPALALLNELEATQNYTFDFVVHQTSLAETLHESLNTIENTLAEAKARISILTSRVTDFATSIEQFHLHYADLYERLKQGADFTRDFLPASVPMPYFFDMTAIPLSDSLLPPTLEVPQFRTELADVESLLANFTEDALYLFNNLVEELRGQASRRLRKATIDITAQLLDVLALTDYDPPRYVGSSDGLTSLSQEAVHLANMGENAKSSAVESFGQLQSPHTASWDELIVPPDPETANHSFTRNATTFDYVNPTYPSFFIPEVLEAIVASLFAYRWMVELVVQFVRLWKLKTRFENEASPDVPEVDFDPANRDEGNDTLYKMFKCTMMLLRHFVSPWTLAILAVLPLIIAGFYYWFPHVQATCIESKNGTFLANNIMTPLLVNEANVAGYSYHVEGEQDCWKQQILMCDHSYADSELLYREDVAAFTVLERRFNQSILWSNLVDGCVDQEVLDSQLQEGCCGLEGYSVNCTVAPFARNVSCPIDRSLSPDAAFRPLATYLSDSACQDPSRNHELDDARFDCSVLKGVCRSVPSNGVDEDFIRSMVIDADCKIEQYLMTCFLLVSLVIYHAIAMNVCCTLILSGFKNICWRYLRPDGIRLKAQMTENGDLLGCDEIADRGAKISELIRRFERLGWLEMSCGIILLSLWVTSIFVLPKYIG